MGEAPVAAPIKPLREVLVADDEHLVAAGLVANLKSIGINACAVARTGEEAIRLATDARPQMALLDIRMPEMDGLECAARLWSEQGIPSVIVSAYSGDQYLAQAAQTGVFGYLLKPVTLESLRAAVTVAWARASNLAETSGRVQQLEDTLAARRAVEQAKWKMVSDEGVTEPDAHAALQKAARSARRRIADIANDYLAGKPLNLGSPGE